jgi:hypothetical protein
VSFTITGAHGAATPSSVIRSFNVITIHYVFEPVRADCTVPAADISAGGQALLVQVQYSGDDNCDSVAGKQLVSSLTRN